MRIQEADGNNIVTHERKEKMKADFFLFNRFKKKENKKNNNS